jgi:hypothetical protein
MLNHESAQPLNVASLRNWIQTTGCLSRDETAYLSAEEDLLCVATQTDTFLLRLELLIERALISGWSSFGQVCMSFPYPAVLRSGYNYAAVYLLISVVYLLVLSQPDFP